MKQMFLFAWAVFFLTACEPKDNYIDTGTCTAHPDLTIYEYLHTNRFDWDSTILLIQQADMVDVFESPEEITFFGITSLSIKRYMHKKRYTRISAMAPLLCKKILEDHIVKGKYMSKDIAFRIPDISGKIVGGTILETLSGRKLLAYKEQDDWGGIQYSGAIHLKLNDLSISVNIPMGSPDIECKNGVVHSLNYDYSQLQ